GRLRQGGGGGNGQGSGSGIGIGNQGRKRGKAPRHCARGVPAQGRVQQGRDHARRGGDRPRRGRRQPALREHGRRHRPGDLLVRDPPLQDPEGLDKRVAPGRRERARSRAAAPQAQGAHPVPGHLHG
ncbi:unnamed protein product, partial [Ectocarpus fasciculatus]